MPVTTPELIAGEVDSRQRVINAAVDLFIRHGFAGTSLQMIADALGFTKAAIYYHFRTREQLLTAVVEPIMGRLRIIVDAAESHRTPRARAERMLQGWAEVAAGHRDLVAVLAADPSVAAMLRAHDDWGVLIDRQLALLAGVEPGPEGLLKAAFVLTGTAGAAARALSDFHGRADFDGRADLDEQALRQCLLDMGRRTLGLRSPRRS